MSQRAPLMITAVLGALVLAACGSSSTVSAGAGASSTAVPTPTTLLTPLTTAQAATAGPLFTTGAVPVVTGATDLSKEPVVAAGTAPAPTSLVGQDLVVGTGAVAGASATVKVQYVGALYTTGKVFDASWTDSGPVTFPLNGVIPGFKDAIIGMKIGGRREIVIPPAEGYGVSGQPPTIPGNATLVFVIDLLAIS